MSSPFSSIEIKDAVYQPPPINIDTIQYRLVEYIFGKKCRFNITLLSGEKPVLNQALVLEGNEFNQWGSDDSYIENWILAKLGFSKKE